MLFNVPLSASLPATLDEPTIPFEQFINNWADINYIPFTNGFNNFGLEVPLQVPNAPGDFVPEVPLDVPDAPVLQGSGSLGRTSSIIWVNPRFRIPQSTNLISPDGSVTHSLQFAVAPEAQVLASMAVSAEQQPVYLPTPESSSTSPAFPIPSIAGDLFSNTFMNFGQFKDYSGLDYQAGVGYDQQVPPLAELPMYQPQLTQNVFLPGSGQLQPVQNAEALPSDFQFTFKAPVPPPITEPHVPVVDDPIFVQPNQVALDGTYSALAWPEVLKPTDSESMLRSKSHHSHIGSLKRQPSTVSASSSSKRRRTTTQDNHPPIPQGQANHPLISQARDDRSSIPEGNWRHELRDLQLNAEGKYFTPSRYFSIPSLAGAGATVRNYACLYVDPYNETQCWRRMNTTQPKEWLNEMNGRKSKGFFPRHEAEMLRHLAVHRNEDVCAARVMPCAARYATRWQDQLIDEQIVKDRDDPHNQIWYPDEKRKSLQELDEELAASGFFPAPLPVDSVLSN
ncbi:hypothetical protein B0J17DRAFT_733344 [Rhizoctonia solani]|nr:hypothetical protein B0J17DRAFT_733344 [Rhizoctonia solani]